MGKYNRHYIFPVLLVFIFSIFLYDTIKRAKRLKRNMSKYYELKEISRPLPVNLCWPVSGIQYDYDQAEQPGTRDNQNQSAIEKLDPHSVDFLLQKQTNSFRTTTTNHKKNQ